MTEVSATDVKSLRGRTGAGMMECKRALADARGDTERAVDLLRERGQAKADRKAGRATGEGTIGIALAGGRAGIVELGSETDFVARTDAFQELAREIAGVVATTPGADTVEGALAAPLGRGCVREAIDAAIGKLGENVELKRVVRIAVAHGITSGYVHAGGKLGVVVGLAGSGDEALAKDVAMHVAAVDPTPLAVDRSGVPADLVEKEGELLMREARARGRPEDVLDDIVAGRLGRFFAQSCLLEQPFVKDAERRVGDLLQPAGATVTGFVRFRLGG